MRYPAVEFVALHGRKLSVVIGLLAGLLAGLHVTLSGFGSLLVVAVAMLSGLAVWGLARLGAELVELIAEGLLPD